MNIELRAWDSEKKKMYLLGKEDDIEFKYDRNGLVAYRRIESTLHYEYKMIEHLVYMQYTGIKDRQGDKIYEGDIVSDDELHGVYVVGWDNKLSRFAIRKLNGEKFVNSVGGYAHYVEIIGNVYENPELIKEVVDG